MRSNQLRWLGWVVAWNLVAAVALSMTFWLGRQGIVVPGYLVGMIAALLPGLLLTLSVEQLTARTAIGSHIMLWAAISSLTVIPAFVYLVDRFMFAGTGVLTPLPAFGCVWIVLLVVFGVLLMLRRVRSGLLSVRLTRTDVRELSLIVGGFFLVLLVNVWLYRYIPEADGYGYLMKLRDAVSQPDILSSEPRILFLTFVNLLSSLTGASPYLVLKLGLPGLFLLVVGTCYLVARSVMESVAGRVVAALSPLAFPVVLQEMLIGRPQSLVMLTFVPALYLVARVTQPAAIQDRHWLLLLLAIGIVGLKIHTLMVLVLLLAVAGAVRMFWPLVRARPIDSLVNVALVFLLAFPWFHSTRIIGDMWHIAELMWQAVARGTVTLWFIDQYRNVDGAEVGWPGFSWLFYYGYNLGVFLPTLVVMLGLGWRRVGSSIRRLGVEWPALLLGSILLSIAEFFPRLGLAYLPDRAWLFVVLCLSLLAPYALAAQLVAHRRTIWVWSLVLCCSLFAGSYVTYAKQGWVTVAEDAAVQFIRDETPLDTVFLGQGGSRPAVRYFAERKLVPPPSDVFLSHNENAVEEFLLEQQRAYDLTLERLRATQTTLGHSFVELGGEVAKLREQSQQVTLKADARALMGFLEQAQYDESVLKEEFVFEDQPIYVLYDRTKFESLYGQRAWWRASNFYGADTDKFTRKYPLVYNEQGVMIWKVR